MADGGDSGRFDRQERTRVVGALVWFHSSVRSDEDPLRTVEPAIVVRVISRNLVDLRVIGPHGAVYDETGVLLWAGHGQRPRARFAEWPYNPPLKPGAIRIVCDLRMSTKRL